ncbi:MAG: class I SAM-dependent methyltransferase [Candidatus Marinimicrobia bacterium]|jgi:SAM-dependent methyltransferase|nr:class I SAM-dependent methyltransferase [Candidatus Neomarinimicrobiota bacterium]MDP6611778.1 class I SAM-dependent methyltransferase [Candidatus Neomarinimicrobiota bacterium]|tara:strand:- start:6360 stop:7010 length:651 start_codon:yes stop_codon:yes gene_type:complete
MKRKTYNRFQIILNPIIKARIPIISHFFMEKVYDKYFFDHANQLKDNTVSEVASIINLFFDFQTVFDIGCGMGLYINELFKNGKTVTGCDFSKDAIQMASKDFLIFYADVTKPIILNQRFDLVICFEVAEHIHTKYSNQLVINCTKYSNKVLFTAAPTGQGGVGHINEQPYDFWINLFKKQNFNYDQSLSVNIRKKLQEERVVDWLSNNFMVFEKK